MADAGSCPQCNCSSELEDERITQLVMWCSTFSLMGLLGAFYVIVATGSVTWQLRLAAPKKMPEYLHNSAVLIVVLAFGTGLGAAIRFLGSMNTAFWGTHWAYEQDRLNECFVSAYLLQFSLWLEMGASIFMAVCYYQLSGQGTAISAKACWAYVATIFAVSIAMAVIPAYVGVDDNASGLMIQGAYENLTVWCWMEDPIHQWSMCVSHNAFSSSHGAPTALAGTHCRFTPNRNALVGDPTHRFRHSINDSIAKQRSCD